MAKVVNQPFELQGDGLDAVRSGQVVLKKGDRGEAVEHIRELIESLVAHEPALKSRVLGYLDPKGHIISLKSYNRDEEDRSIFNEALRRVVKQTQKYFSFQMTGDVNAEMMTLLDRLSKAESNALCAHPAEQLAYLLLNSKRETSILSEFKSFAAQQVNALQVVLEFQELAQRGKILVPREVLRMQLPSLVQWATAIELAKLMRAGGEEEICKLLEVLHLSPQPVDSVLLLKSNLPSFDASGTHANPDLAKLDALLEEYMNSLYEREKLAS